MSDVDNPTDTENPTPHDELAYAAQLVALGLSSEALSLLDRLPVA